MVGYVAQMNKLHSSQQTSSDATANAYAESSKANESKPQSSATDIVTAKH
jgi:hypothetical protein